MIKLNDKKIYYASTNLGLYKSENLRDWDNIFYLKDYVDIANIGTSVYVSNFIYDKVYVGTENGVYFSEDFGKNWKFLGLEKAKIFEIRNYKSNGFIISGDSGVYFYNINKKYLYSLNNSLTNDKINNLFIDEKYNIYVGTDGSGIFKLINNIQINLTINYSFMEKYPKITWYTPELENYEIRGFELYRGESLEKMELLKIFEDDVYEFIDNEVEERKKYYYYLIAIYIL